VVALSFLRVDDVRLTLVDDVDTIGFLI